MSTSVYTGLNRLILFANTFCRNISTGLYCSLSAQRLSERSLVHNIAFLDKSLQQL